MGNFIHCPHCGIISFFKPKDVNHIWYGSVNNSNYKNVFTCPCCNKKTYLEEMIKYKQCFVDYELNKEPYMNGLRIDPITHNYIE